MLVAQGKKTMRRGTFIIAVITFLVGGFIGWAVGASPMGRQIATLPQAGIGGAPVVQQLTDSSKELELRMGMRKLWTDHVTLTRNFIISSVADLEDQDEVLARLLENQEDIGDSIKPYYGSDAGKRLTDLLKEHITIAGDIITAAKANNTSAQATAEDKWFDNADQIASFLSSANSNWKKDDVKDMLDEHLNLTKQELVARLNDDFDGDIAAFDRVLNQALTMADQLSDGIIKQFPDMFR